MDDVKLASLKTILCISTDPSNGTPQISTDFCRFHMNFVNLLLNLTKILYGVATAKKPPTCDWIKNSFRMILLILHAVCAVHQCNKCRLNDGWECNGGERLTVTTLQLKVEIVCDNAALLHSYYAATTHYTVTTQLLHSCYTVTTQLLYCCYTIAILLIKLLNGVLHNVLYRVLSSVLQSQHLKLSLFYSNSKVANVATVPTVVTNALS